MRESLAINFYHRKSAWFWETLNHSKHIVAGPFKRRCDAESDLHDFMAMAGLPYLGDRHE